MIVQKALNALKSQRMEAQKDQLAQVTHKNQTIAVQKGQ
jgi:hypothetical protein